MKLTMIDPVQGSATKSQQGFTLIELVIVIAVLGALAAIAVPQLTGVQDRAEVAGRASTLSSEINSAFAEELSKGTLELDSSGYNWTGGTCGDYGGIMGELDTNGYKLVGDNGSVDGNGEVGKDEFVKISLPTYAGGSVGSINCFFGLDN